MTKILGLSGSLRKASYNSALLRTLAELAPDGVEVTIASIAEVPLYDGDLEAEKGLPEPVKTLQHQLSEADGLLLVTPEYNSGVPGVLKNTIDWMSRGGGMGLFQGKPVALASASPGRFGGTLAQVHWLPVFRLLNMQFWPDGKLSVSGASNVFDDAGTMTDDTIRDLSAKFIAGYAQSLA